MQNQAQFFAADETHAIVGDIGGTHARLALTGFGGARPRVLTERIYDSRGEPHFSAVLSRFLKDAGIAEKPPVIVLAVAGPVVDGHVTLTNLGWHLKERDLADFGFRRCRLMNDFAALAVGVTALPADGLARIGPDLPGRTDGALAVVGAGTGFGAAGVLRGEGAPRPFASEGGHISFAPIDDVEIEVLRILQKKFGHVSIERVLSGPGMVNLHAALAQLRGDAPNDGMNDAAAIAKAAEEGDKTAHETVERFCMIYGSAAGDFALAYGATGGVFLAGGIAPKMRRHLEAGGFRARFEAKGRLSHFVKAVPTTLVLRDDAALLGATEVAKRLNASGT